MSYTEPNDKVPSSAGLDASPSGSMNQRPLTRGFWTYYGDGIIEYEYTPTWGNAQRVCGVLGKDKAVSYLQVPTTGLIVGNDRDSEKGFPKFSLGGCR
jgi:hypothetical protein